MPREGLILYNSTTNANATPYGPKFSSQSEVIVECGRGLFEMGRVLSGKSAASVVSEGSVGSFSNESATTQLDYLRLKSEHRKLQNHLEICFRRSQ
ncbi:unnamed protein product [Anisakis simplex]|nr:unnamed protein product [Anisakis simplex]